MHGQTPGHAWSYIYLFFLIFFFRVIQEQTSEINTGNRCLHRIESERSRSLWESDEYVLIDPHHPRFLHTGCRPGHDLISPIRRSTSAPNQLVHTEASLILKEKAVSEIDRSRFRTRRKCRHQDYQNM